MERQGTLDTLGLAESPPHPDFSLRVKSTSPRKRGEVIRALAPIQLKAIEL